MAALPEPVETVSGRPLIFALFWLPDASLLHFIFCRYLQDVLATNTSCVCPEYALIADGTD